jgi:hypothetical protein
MHAAQIIDRDRLTVRAIFGQQAQQVRNSERGSVARDQGSQAIFPSSVASGTRQTSTGVCLATSAREIDPEQRPSPTIADTALDRLVHIATQAGFVGIRIALRHDRVDANMRQSFGSILSM